MTTISTAGAAGAGVAVGAAGASAFLAHKEGDKKAKDELMERFKEVYRRVPNDAQGT